MIQLDPEAVDNVAVDVMYFNARGSSRFVRMDWSVRLEAEDQKMP